MGTHMLLFPEQEHLRRVPAWDGMHDAGGASGSWMGAPSYGQGVVGSGGGGNTWSKRMAAHGEGGAGAEAESWEVRAFAEDASSSGQWPPRSYACSFCHREFRTAQALGGHMNVHRRERNVLRSTQLPLPDPSPAPAPAARPSTADPRAFPPAPFLAPAPSFHPSYHSAYHTSYHPRDSNVDLELRLGPRYD